MALFHSSSQVQQRKADTPVFHSVRSATLQARCVNHEQLGTSGEREASRHGSGTELKRTAIHDGSLNRAPLIVHEVLQSPGHPLDGGLRALMEPHFGHDFSRVRVHTDSKAAESAQAVNALAYTVGKQIVFGKSQYAPQTDSGRKLVAHELAHVVQQEQATSNTSDSHLSQASSLRIQPAFDSREWEADAAADEFSTARYVSATDSPLVQRAPIEQGSSPLGSRGTLPYREAVELLECIRIMGQQNADFCRQQVLGEGPATGLPAQTATIPGFTSCLPARPLTWSDFTGQPSGTHSAFTAYNYTPVTTGGISRIQAVFDSGRSFVRPQFGNPTNPNLNGCAANVTNCESYFPPGTTGGSFALNSTPSATCPAAIRANSAVVAHSFSDCAGIIATECQRVAQTESDRLLRHEQLHLDIACVLVAKANAALAAGASLPTIQTALNTKDAQVTNQYDTQTNHGCLKAPQATWETNVRAGLPAVTIP